LKFVLLKNKRIFSTKLFRFDSFRKFQKNVKELKSNEAFPIRLCMRCFVVYLGVIYTLYVQMLQRVTNEVPYLRIMALKIQTSTKKVDPESYEY
jgi:hypothetical protein